MLILIPTFVTTLTWCRNPGEMSALTRRKSTRAAHKSHATRLMKDINELLQIVDTADEAQMIKLKKSTIIEINSQKYKH